MGVGLNNGEFSVMLPPLVLYNSIWVSYRCLSSFAITRNSLLSSPDRVFHVSPKVASATLDTTSGFNREQVLVEKKLYVKLYTRCDIQDMVYVINTWTRKECKQMKLCVNVRTWKKCKQTKTRRAAMPLTRSVS